MPKLQAPASGVTIRMYRQGHGDCFVLAFPREDGGEPVYVLIDCGLKPGSQQFIHRKGIDKIVAHIGDATDAHLDLAVITHEHQDHLNGIWKTSNPYFGGFQIDEAWLAWTEDPDDELADQLRARHHDQLLSLLDARRKLALAADADDGAVRAIDSLLSFELGGGEESLSPAEMLAAAEDPARSVNKQALKLIKSKAAQQRGVRYLSPGGAALQVPGTGVRVYVLGPPRSEDLLADEDPRGSEAFPDDAHALSFSAAASASDDGIAPFSRRFAVPLAEAIEKGFFAEHYGKSDEGADDRADIEVADTAPWRRIDADWLYSAETLALKMNTGINNTSLVLAFELPVSKKVLFFAGDAQRGNWISWTDHDFESAGGRVTARDLLGRSVLYKVGHHGSHNATLAGSVSDNYANLSWMATGEMAGEFTAMITAVTEWALTKNDPPWRHPLPSIRQALLKKAQGRVFQTDVDRPARPDHVEEADWQAFESRCVFDELYFDYTVPDVAR